MSSTYASEKIVSVDEQAFEQADERAIDEGGFEAVDETPEFRATVEMEIQAKVDSNHPDARIEAGPDHMVGKTLAQEERIKAREAELERISAQAELGIQEGREKRTRAIAAQRSAKRRYEFQKRAASVDPMADPERPDPREELSQKQLAAVNEQSMRLAAKLAGWSRAAISRRLAERVVSGTSLTSAVVGVYEELRTAPGQVIPIADVQEVNRKEVSIEGTITQFWKPSNPNIAQVGLIEDDSGRTKFTSWKASDTPWMDEGERVQICSAAKNWYNGRVSVALTGWTTVHFPDRGRWWEA
jgi:hypothetical protein